MLSDNVLWDSGTDSWSGLAESLRPRTSCVASRVTQNEAPQGAGLENLQTSNQLHGESRRTGRKLGRTGPTLESRVVTAVELT
jgi:hypothetical protein